MHAGQSPVELRVQCHTVFIDSNLDGSWSMPWYTQTYHTYHGCVQHFVIRDWSDVLALTLAFCLLTVSVICEIQKLARCASPHAAQSIISFGLESHLNVKWKLVTYPHPLSIPVVCLLFFTPWCGLMLLLHLPISLLHLPISLLHLPISLSTCLLHRLVDLLICLLYPLVSLSVLQSDTYLRETYNTGDYRRMFHALTKSLVLAFSRMLFKFVQASITFSQNLLSRSQASFK